MFHLNFLSKSFSIKIVFQIIKSKFIFSFEQMHLQSFLRTLEKRNGTKKLKMIEFITQSQFKKVEI